MVRKHHWLNGDAFEQTDSNGDAFEQTAGDSEGQRSLACCSPWGHKETGFSNWTTTTNLNWVKRQERRQAQGGEERKKWIKKEQITSQLIQQILSLLSPLWPIGFSLRCKFPHCSWEMLHADSACWFWPQLCLMKFLSNEDHHGSVGSHRSFHSFQKQPHSHLTLRTLH